MNRWNSYEVNFGPLSEMRCTGIPHEKDHDLRYAIVLEEVLEVIGKTVMADELTMA